MNNVTCLRLATYNIHEGYDGFDDPLTNDKPKKPEKSLDAVGAVLSDSGADIVSLQEVENADVLHDLLKRGDLARRFPYHVLVEAKDKKGIDVALLSRYPITRYETHQDETIGDDKGKPRRFMRDLLEVDVALPGDQTLRVFSNHYVKHGGGWCDKQRLAEAEATARIVTESASAMPAAHYVVMGDFNDTEESPVLQAVAAADLFNTSEGLPPSWGTNWPHPEYEPALFDHILVSNSLRPALLQSGVLSHPAAAWASDHNLVWADLAFPQPPATLL